MVTLMRAIMAVGCSARWRFGPWHGHCGLAGLSQKKEINDYEMTEKEKQFHRLRLKCTISIVVYGAILAFGFRPLALRFIS